MAARKPRPGDPPKARKKPAWKQSQGTPEQLSMFVTGRDIKANYDPMHGDRRRSQRIDGLPDDVASPEETWKAKLSVSKDQPSEGGLPQSLYDYTAVHGVDRPVHLSTQFGPHGASGGPYPDAPRGDRREVLGGHHRIAAQDDIDPDRLIPVLHHENFQEIEHHIQNVQGRPGETWKYR